MLSSTNSASTFISMHINDFPPETIPQIRQALENMTPQQIQSLMMMDFKNPTLALLLSVFLGCLGVDRFYIGDIGMGIGKLLTGGGCGIWWLVDLFLITNATRRKNYETLYMVSSQF